MKTLCKPLFGQKLLLISSLMLLNVFGFSQKLDTLLLKKNPGRPRPQIEVKPTKEDSIKTPVTTDQSKFDDLLKKAQGSADVVSLLRQAKELCTTTKLENCDSHLKIAFSREIKRLIDLNNQDRLKEARDLCDLYSVDNCSERIREKDAQLRFDALIEAGKNAGGFEQKRSKFLEAKAFCEKNSLVVLNWNCQSTADDLLKKLHADRYTELLNSIVNRRTFEEKWKTLAEVEALVNDNPGYLNGKKTEINDRKYRLQEDELGRLRSKMEQSSTFDDKEKAYWDAVDFVKKYQLSDKSLNDLDYKIREAARLEVQNILYRRRQLDYRRRIEQLRYAIRLNRDYVGEQLNREITSVIYKERDDAIAEAGRQPTLRLKEDHLRTFAGEYCKLLSTDRDQNACFAELENLIQQAYQAELAALQQRARQAASGNDWSLIHNYYNQAIVFADANPRYFNSYASSSLRGEKQEALRKYADNSQRRFVDHLRSDNLSQAETALYDLQNMQRTAGFQFLNTNDMLVDLHQEYLRKIGNLRDQQRFQEGFRALDKVESLEQQMTGALPQNNSREERRRLSQDHYSFLAKEAERWMFNPGTAETAIRRFNSLDSVRTLYRPYLTETQTAQVARMRRSFSLRTLGYLDQYLRNDQIDAGVVLFEDLSTFITTAQSGDSLTNAFVSRGPILFGRKVDAQKKLLEGMIASGALDDAAAVLARFRKENITLARNLKVSANQPDPFVDTEFKLQLTRGQTLVAQGNPQKALDLLHPLVENNQTSSLTLRDDAKRLRDQVFADLLDKKLSDVERTYDQQAKYEALKNFRQYLAAYPLPVPAALQSRYKNIAKASCFEEREMYETGIKNAEQLINQRKFAAAYDIYQKVFAVCQAATYCDLDIYTINEALRKYEAPKDFELAQLEFQNLEKSKNWEAFESQYRKLERSFETNNLSNFGFKLQPMEQYLRDPKNFDFAAYYVGHNCLFTDQIPLISEILNANYATSGAAGENFKSLVYTMADRFHEANPQTNLKEAQKFFSISGKAAKGVKKGLKTRWKTY
ncbi:MAG: hypothetical protein SFV55_02065 [Haliscomenobacter sp.]|uniref:hypothetical protein n=1 Tax=Haliscomenobacter sp. TaxID=2717303 RepID=UPI0029B97F90|nr:hypothetical protein [Haliscomenobacter sp.]MDX2067177.1 hypothetical protein [Haliscomenobacter sp.]